MKIVQTIFVLLFFLTAFLNPGLCQAVQEKDKMPNIIYILADDAGYGDFGVFGQKEINTPAIDTMAREGIRFTNHYAGTTVCAPSRCSFLTGKHTGHTFIRGNREMFPEGQLALPPGTRTIASLLRKAGMRTGIIGKWGLGGPGTTGVPTGQGFDDWYGYLCQRQAHSYYPSHLWRNEEKIELDGSQYTHDLFTRRAIEFIHENKDRPFFLYLAYTIPHAKLQVPDLSPYAEKDWEDSQKKYAAMITRMDRDIGKIMTALKRLGIDERTLVVFASDNGPHAEGGADPAFFNSAGGLRGKKRDLYEGGIRVPMVAMWPGRIEPGSKSDHVSAFWDMLPTFAELAGIDAPEGIDGISMVPALMGRPAQQKAHAYLYWEVHEHGGKQAVRINQWKGIRLNVRNRPDGPIELYNRSLDPGEEEDVAAQHPLVVGKISTIMKTARTASPEFPLVGKRNYHFGVYNGWIFSLVFLVSSTALILTGRRANRKELIGILAYCSTNEKFLFILSFTIAAAMFAMAAFLPLWGGTRWFDYGVIVSLVGLSGHMAAWGQFLFRKPGRLMTGGLYAVSRNPKEVFSWIFWSGIGIATVAKPLFLLLLVWMGFRHFVVRVEERVCGLTYGEAYSSYKDRVPRYFLIF